MANGTALAALLELVQASGGSVATCIRLQKQAYLLAAFGASSFRWHSFSYHHYGPFSRELSDTLQFAVSAGLLSEGHESFSEGSQRYSYELTDDGRSFVSQSGPTLQKFRPLIDRISNEHWRSLELASTVDFLLRSRAVGSWDESFVRALQLKPETRPYQNDAADLLRDLHNQTAPH